jgi:hypothetical protein
MFSAEQLKHRIRKAALELGVTDTNRVRTIVTLERIIARLMANPYLKEHLVFGGGFVLFKEFGSDRYTKDADAIIKGERPEIITDRINEALSADLDDGFWFGDIKEEILEAENGYGGIRFNILYKVGGPFPTEEEKNNLRRIHLDISIGVDLEDVAKFTKTESLLESLSSIEWKVYPPEFIASEKIHCLLHRGYTNSRGKDIYDLSLIFKEVTDESLLNAIHRTFSRRNFKIVSLYEVAKAVDTENLVRGYYQSQTESFRYSFDEAWKIILEKFEQLDLLRMKGM